jgi:HEPN domain-containing protein
LALGRPSGKIKTVLVNPKGKDGIVNRAQLRQLAEDRILDAAQLLAGGRWAGAYYLAGYAVECGLKACIMAYVEATGVIFQERKFSEKCWTHDFEELLKLADLKPTLEADTATNAAFATNWTTAKDWEETDRYEQKTQAEAQALSDAITNDPNGVLPWIRIPW